MPYNLELEKRINWVSAKLGFFDQKKMFGGVGYLLHGNMAFGIHKQWLLLRVPPEKSAGLLKQEHFSLFNITGRPMAGWVLVAEAGVGNDEQLLALLKMSVDYVKTLPAK